MKTAKILILSLFGALFFFSCTPKNLSGTYTSLPSTPSYQNHSRVILYLYNDSTFHYIELKGACWYNADYESVGKWILYNKTIILNSNKLASDTMRLSSSKNVKYKELVNYSFRIKRRKLLDTTQTNIDLKNLKKTSSETNMIADCGNK